MAYPKMNTKHIRAKKEDAALLNLIGGGHSRFGRHSDGLSILLQAAFGSIQDWVCPEHIVPHLDAIGSGDRPPIMHELPESDFYRVLILAYWMKHLECCDAHKEV